MGWKGRLVEGPVWLAGRFVKGGPDPRCVPPREILVLRPNDYGDLLTTTPIFEALRRRFPATRIIAGVGSWARAILENNPFIDEILEIDAPWNNKFVVDQSWPAVARFLWRSEQLNALRKRGGFDVGIDILGSHVGAVLMMRLGVRHRVGVRGYRGGWSACRQYIRFSWKVHVARAALAQAELLGATDLPEARPQIYLTAAERADAARLWASAAPMPALRLLVGCGAGLEEKAWPAEALGMALQRLMRLPTRPTPLSILVVGGSADAERAQQIVAAAGPGAQSACGCTTIRGTFALVEQADLVLTNPTMLLHVAAAFHRPTVAVLGGPYSDAKAHDVRTRPPRAAFR